MKPSHPLSHSRPAIGANTAIFSVFNAVFNAVLLIPLPYGLHIHFMNIRFLPTQRLPMQARGRLT